LSPNLDIYCLTKLRNAETIDRFIDLYVDSDLSEDLGDGDIMIRSLDVPLDYDDGGLSVEYELAHTFSHCIQRGLDYPRRCFTLYLRPKQADFTGVILQFTADDRIILGLSIDDTGAEPKNLERAKVLLNTLRSEFSGDRGLILVEQPPPDSEQIFEKINEDSYPLCVYSCAW
jgi:hypothetical protein